MGNPESQNEEQQNQEEPQAKGSQERQEQAESTTVPKERLDELAAQVKQLTETNATLQENMAIASANSGAARQNQPAITVYEAAGIKIPEDPDNNVLSFTEQEKLDTYRASQNAAMIADLHFKLDHPDYQKLVGTASQLQSRQYAKPLARALKANPALEDQIKNATDPREAAYQIAVLYSASPEEKGALTEAEQAASVLEEAANNANRVKSVATVQGGGGLSEQSRFENMPLADFLTLARKNGAEV